MAALPKKRIKLSETETAPEKIGSGIEAKRQISNRIDHPIGFNRGHDAQDPLTSKFAQASGIIDSLGESTSEDISTKQLHIPELKPKLPRKRLTPKAPTAISKKNSLKRPQGIHFSLVIDTPNPLANDNEDESLIAWDFSLAYPWAHPLVQQILQGLSSALIKK